MLSGLDVALADVTELPLTGADVRALHMNRIVARYGRLLKFCELVLDAVHPDLQAGTRHGFALLFDMNRLFQRYVSICIETAISIDAAYRGLIATFEQPQLNLTRWISSSDSSHQRMFTLKPDIVINDRIERRAQAVIDAKWKLLSQNAANKFDIAEQDMYQMFAYAMRYGTQSCALVYPWHATMGNIQIYRFELLTDAPAHPVAMNVHVVDLENEPIDMGQRILSSLPAARTQLVA
jgi:5-methylcytosine-specific restriction enzyme subunit McrC